MSEFDDNASSKSQCGTLFIVATPIGNLEDLSFRAKRVLSEVDCIAAEDTRRVRLLMDRYGIKAKRVISYFLGNEASRVDDLIQVLEEGESIALVSDAGTPSISDPGERLITAVRDRGLKLEVIPGPSAVVAALVGSGLSASQFFFAGFLPRVESQKRNQIAALRQTPATLVFYESPNRTGETLEFLRDALGGDRRACVARELTKMHEEFVHGTLTELSDKFKETSPRGEIVVLVEGSEISADVEEGLETQIVGLLEQGLGPKDIAARLVISTGKPKRHLYQLALSLKRQGES